MQRIINIPSVPTSFSAVAANSLYGLLKAQAGAVPVDGILPDRGCGLKLTTPAANTGTVQLFDRSGVAGTISIASALTTLYDRVGTSMRNTIDLNALFPVGSAANQALLAAIDYT